MPDWVLQLLGVILGASWLTALVTWKVHRDKLPLDRDSSTVANAERLVAVSSALMDQLRARVTPLELEVQREAERTAAVTEHLNAIEREASQTRSALVEIAHWLEAQWRAIPEDQWVPHTSPIPDALRQYIDETLIAEIEQRGHGAP